MRLGGKKYATTHTRDQISFNYLARKMGVTLNYFPGTVLDNPNFRRHKHKAEQMRLTEFARSLHGDLRGLRKIVSRIPTISRGTVRFIKNTTPVETLRYLKCALSPKKYVVSANSFGLISRLNCLLHSLKISESLSREIIIHWPKNLSCNCKFSDLFATHIIEFDAPELLKILGNGPLSQKLKIVNLAVLAPNPIETTAHFAKNSASRTAITSDHGFITLAETNGDSFSRYLTMLTPVPYIQNEVARFAKKFDYHTVSVNIRSWSEDKPHGPYLINVEAIFGALDALPTSNFFVSSDAPHVVKMLIARYPRRILFYPDRSFHTSCNYSKENMQDLLINILLLAKNKHFISPPASAFSELAWCFGDYKFEVFFLKSTPNRDNFLHSEVREAHV